MVLSFILLTGCRSNAVAERFSFSIEEEQITYREFLQSINKEHPSETGFDGYVSWSDTLYNLGRKMDTIANKSKKLKYQNDKEFQLSIEEDKVNLIEGFLNRDIDDGSKDSVIVVGYSKVPDWRMNSSIDERNRIYNSFNILKKSFEETFGEPLPYSIEIQLDIDEDLYNTQNDCISLVTQFGFEAYPVDFTCALNASDYCTHQMDLNCVETELWIQESCSDYYYNPEEEVCTSYDEDGNCEDWTIYPEEEGYDGIQLWLQFLANQCETDIAVLK